MKLVVGNRLLARHVFSHLLDTSHSIAGVVSATGDVAKRQAGFASLTDLAVDHGVPIHETETVNDEETRDVLRSWKADLAICPGWHQIISEATLSIPRLGFVGFHASRLPEGRGGAPVNWALLHGSDELWLSLFQYEPGVDSGPVVRQANVPIEDRDDVGTLLDKLAIAAREILSDVSQDFECSVRDATPQPVSDATYRPRRKWQDGVLQWSSSVDSLLDAVRAQTKPYPGAFTFHDGQKLTIWTASAIRDSSPSDAPGTIVSVEEGVGIDITTDDGVLRLHRVQLQDDPEMWADDYATRSGLAVGDTLGRQHAPESWLYTGIRDESGGTNYQTNLELGESGTIQLFADAPTGTRSVHFQVDFDGVTCYSEEVSVDSRITREVDYRAERTGTIPLTVTFHENDTEMDTRHVKVFVPD